MPVADVRPSGPSAGAVVDAKNGFLENVPLGWLRHFLQCQPWFNRYHVSRTLFESSKCLAKRILEVEPNVSLQIDCVRSMQLTAEQAQARCSILTDLLSVRQTFQVELSPTGWQCFPVQLADRVTMLKIYDAQATVGCPWDAMTRLRTVHFECTKCTLPRVLVSREFSGLCDAVQAGQLQQLRTLHLPLYSQINDMHRLVLALGPQLEEVESSCGLLIIHLSQFKNLRRITLRRCCLSEGMMQQLCEHPTLQHVTLQGCSVEGIYSQHSCTWDTLTMHDVALQTLVCLPLSSLQQICLVGRWCAGRVGNIQAVDDMLGQHVHKLVCLPARNSSCFTIGAPCGAMTALIKRMHGVKRLTFTSSIEPHVVPLLWQSLPASVTWVEFDFTLDGNWNDLWQGIPQQVACICLIVCPTWASDLRTILHTTPTTVHSVVLEVRLDEFCTVDIAELRAMAPQHLQLELSY